MTGTRLHTEFLAQRKMLLRMLTARLRSADEAEDVLQELWLKLEQNPPGPVAQPGAYLFRMASNIALDRRRGDVRRQTRETIWMSLQPAAEEYPDAERALVAGDRLKRIEAAVAALPDRTGQAFRLYRLEGYARPRIAEQMGISVSAVEKLIHRAYRHIHDFDAPAAVHSAAPRHQDTKGVSGRDQ